MSSATTTTANATPSDADVVDIDLTSYLSCLERTSLEVFAAELISRHPHELRRLRELVRRPVSGTAVLESLNATDADMDSVDEWCAYAAPTVSDWLSRARAYMSAGAITNAIAIAQALTTETVRRITAATVRSNKRRRIDKDDDDGDGDTSTSSALNVLESVWSEIAAAISDGDAVDTISRHLLSSRAALKAAGITDDVFADALRTLRTRNRTAAVTSLAPSD